MLDLFVEERGRPQGLPCRRAGPGNHPQPDRQDAASVVRHADRGDGARAGEQIGYSNLIESLLGHSLDKGARFTDWGRRPLDKRQIDYAIADVTHLATIFPRMVEKLTQDRTRRLARRGNGAARRPVELRLSSGGRMEAAQAAEPQCRGARAG